MLDLKLLRSAFSKRLVICHFADQSGHLRTEVLLEFRKHCLGVFDCVM